MIRETNPMAPILLSMFTTNRIVKITTVIFFIFNKTLLLTDIGVALSCSIEFGNVGYLKAFHELRPNLRPQAVTENGANLVLSVLGRWLCGQHIAAHLPDVLSNLKQDENSYK